MSNLLKLIPTVVAVIQAAEDLMPDGEGKAKLTFVMDTMENIYGAINEQLPSITKLVAAIVAGLHAVGLFKHKPKPPTPDVGVPQ